MPSVRPIIARQRPSFLVQALWLLWKDLVVEVRTREIVYTMLVFAVLVVLVFAFAFVREGQASPDVAAGILWIATAFSGTLGLGRALDREREGDTLRALLLSPADRPAIYLGKLLGIVVYMLIAEAVIAPLIAVLFDAPFASRPGTLAALLVLGTLGFAAVGSLFAAMLMRARSRDVLLAIVLYPLTVPVIIAGVLGTAALCQSPPNDADARMWLKMLGVFDVVFVTLSLWIFEPLLTD
ncbi:MAG TPA: heme exporter protein CcmB [Polyangia bacterium]